MLRLAADNVNEASCGSYPTSLPKEVSACITRPFEVAFQQCS